MKSTEQWLKCFLLLLLLLPPALTLTVICSEPYAARYVSEEAELGVRLAFQLPLSELAHVPTVNAKQLRSNRSAVDSKEVSK